jgi:hypothetical protein
MVEGHDGAGAMEDWKLGDGNVQNNTAATCSKFDEAR